MNFLIYLDESLAFLESSRLKYTISLEYLIIFESFEQLDFTIDLKHFLDDDESVKISTIKDIVCDFYYDINNIYMNDKLSNFFKHNKY